MWDNCFVSYRQPGMRHCTLIITFMLALAVIPAQAEPGSDNSNRQINHMLRQAAQLGRMNHIRESIDFCNRILAIDPNCGQAFNIKGLGEVALSQNKEGIRDLEQAIKLHGADQQSYRTLEAAHVELNQLPQALAALTAGINSVPLQQCDDEIVRERGEFYVMAHDYKKALQDFSLAMKLKPEKATNWYCRGKAYFAMGEYEKAVQDFSKVIVMEPKNYRVYGMRANAYTKMGKIDLAERDKNKAKLGDIDY